MSTAAVHALTREDIEAWCDAHPYDFDKLVVAKASSTSVKSWHEAHVSPAILSQGHQQWESTSNKLSAGELAHRSTPTY
jgi:hypothetical protein